MKNSCSPATNWAASLQAAAPGRLSPQLYKLTPYTLWYPSGHLWSAVGAVSPPSFLGTPSLLTGGVGWGGEKALRLCECCLATTGTSLKYQCHFQHKSKLQSPISSYEENEPHPKPSAASNLLHSVILQVLNPGQTTTFPVEPYDFFPLLQAVFPATYHICSGFTALPGSWQCAHMVVSESLRYHTPLCAHTAMFKHKKRVMQRLICLASLFQA